MEVKFTHRFPMLNSEKIRLRQMSSSDAEFIHFMRNDPKVNEFVNRAPTKDLEDARFFIDQRHQDFFNKKAVFWIIELNTTGFPVGTITLWNIDFENCKAEIGFDLHPSFHQKGIMTEAARLVLDFGFNVLAFEQIHAITSPKNIASVSLLEKLSFHLLDISELSEIDQENGLIGFIKNR